MIRWNHKGEYEAESVDEWLAIATGELVDAARQRIEPELRNHYAATVEDGLLKGKSLHEAERAAIASLGNAKHAAKRFRRDNLTKDEHVALMNDLGLLMNCIVLFALYAKMVNPLDFLPVGSPIVGDYRVALGISWVIATLGTVLFGAALYMLRHGIRGGMTARGTVMVIHALSTALWILFGLQLSFRVVHSNDIAVQFILATFPLGVFAYTILRTQRLLKLFRISMDDLQTNQ